MGIKFVPFNRRENRRSLAIFFAEEIAHLGALEIARFCGGAVKIAAATAENRAILVHSGVEGGGSFPCRSDFPSLSFPGAVRGSRFTYVLFFLSTRDWQKNHRTF